MNDQINSAIRTLLKIAGGVLVTKGMVSSSNLDILISAILVIAGAVWSAWHHKQNPSTPKG